MTEQCSIAALSHDLAETAELYKSLVDLSPDPIVIHVGGIIVFVNRAMLELYGGESDEELLGQKIIQYVAPECRRLVAGRMREALNGTVLPYVRERLVTRDSSIVDVEVGGRPVLWKGQRAVQLVVRDVTEQIRQSNILERSVSELRRFAHVAAHDLQTPLRHIVWYLELLETEKTDSLDEEAREYLKIAVDGAVRMKNMIVDLLVYSEIESSEIPEDNVEVYRASREALSTFSTDFLDAGINISIDMVPNARVNFRQIVTVFRHLFSNCVKFCDATRPLEIAVTGDVQNCVAHYVVKDNGIGISADDLDEIFEVFKRLHPRTHSPGTGVGLGICRKIIERHGGAIWAESVKGEGTSIHFTIPQSRKRPLK